MDLSIVCGLLWAIGEKLAFAVTVVLVVGAPLKIFSFNYMDISQKSGRL